MLILGKQVAFRMEYKLKVFVMNFA